MRTCSNCGAQIPEGANNCPNCGTPVNANPAPDTTAPQQQYFAGGNPNRPKVMPRSIVTCILLSIVTCGIYGIIWYIGLVNDVNFVCQDEKSSQSGGTVFLLTLLTCGIYGIIWFFNAGKRLHEAGNKYNVQISDNSTVYLVLSLIGLQIIDYCMVQSDLNKFN